MPQAGTGHEQHRQTNSRHGDSRSQVRLREHGHHHRRQESAAADQANAPIPHPGAHVLAQLGEGQDERDLGELTGLKREVANHEPASGRQMRRRVREEEDAQKQQPGHAQGRQGHALVALVVHGAQRQCQHQAGDPEGHLLQRVGVDGSALTEHGWDACAGDHDGAAQRQQHGEEQQYRILRRPSEPGRCGMRARCHQLRRRGPGLADTKRRGS